MKARETEEDVVRNREKHMHTETEIEAGVSRQDSETDAC